jgi:hypothetical protein
MNFFFCVQLIGLYGSSGLSKLTMTLELVFSWVNGCLKSGSPSRARLVSRDKGDLGWRTCVGRRKSWEPDFSRPLSKLPSRSEELLLRVVQRPSRVEEWLIRLLSAMFVVM